MCWKGHSSSTGGAILDQASIRQCTPSGHPWLFPWHRVHGNNSVLGMQSAEPESRLGASKEGTAPWSRPHYDTTTCRTGQG
jgi:hypothetical protein